MAEKQMSFLPEDYVARRIEQRTNLICLSLFAVVLAGVVGAYMVTTRHRIEARNNREVVNKSYAEAAKRIEQLEQLQTRKQEMLRKAQVTATLIEPVPRTFLLADLVNRMPATLSLTEMKLTTKVDPIHMRSPATKPVKTALAGKIDEPVLEKIEAPPKSTVTIELYGLAPTDVQVAQFMAQLSQSKLVTDVNLVFSEESRVEDAVMRRFRVEMTLQPNADVRQLDPLSVPRKIKNDPLRPTQSALGKPPAGPPDPVLTADHPAGEN